MGKHNGGGKGQRAPMTADAAARIQSAGDRAPDSRTARSGFGPRAQSTAAQHGEDHALADDED